MKQRIIAVLAILIVASLMLPSSALSQPMVCNFYGAVTLDGANVPDGTAVKAWIDTAEAAATTTTTYQGHSVYSLNITGNYFGKTVAFTVGAGNAPASQTAAWEAGGVKNVDLTAVSSTLEGVIFSPAPTTAGAVAQYTVSFTTSASGALPAGAGMISVIFPAGIIVPVSISKNTVAVSIDGNPMICTIDPVVAGQTIYLAVPILPIPNSTQVSVIFSQLAGIRNPSTAGSYTGQVSTSADPAPVTSASYSITEGQPTGSSVSSVTFSPAPATAGAVAQHTVSFTTSASGALPPGVGTISVIFPAGIIVPVSISKNTVAVSIDGNPMICTIDPVVAGQTIYLAVPILPIPNSTQVSVTFSQLAGIRNPSAYNGSGYRVQVYTSTDLVHVSSMPPVIFTPVVQFSPTQGPTGQMLTVTGAGFTPGTGITLSGAATQATPGTVNADGTFTMTGVAVATAAVTATDGAGVSATSAGSFTLIPGVTVTPDTAPVGTTVDVRATTFGAFVYVTATWAGTAIATNPTLLQTDPNGNVSFSIVVPACASGAYQISVTDGINTATTTFTVGNPATSVTVAVSPNYTSALAEYTFSFTTTYPLVTGSMFMVRFPSATVIPAAISASYVAIGGMGCTIDPIMFLHNPVIIVCPTDIPAGTSTTITFSQAAGIRNPFVAGSYVAAVSPSGSATSAPYSIVYVGSSISGHVYDAGPTQQPISGVNVTILDTLNPPVFIRSITTDATGYYQLADIPAGSYRLFAVGPNYNFQAYNGKGFVSQADTLTLSAGQIFTLDFNLTYGAGTISGTVYQADGTTPIPNATIMAFDAATNQGVFAALSGTNGTYTIPSLPPGNYKVQATSGPLSEWYHDKGSFAQADTVTVASLANTPNINFTLGQAIGSISGTVKDQATGLPLPNVSVDVWESNLQVGGGATTDQNGNYTIGGLPFGVYVVRAPAWGRFGSGDGSYVRQYYYHNSNQLNYNPVEISPTTPVRTDINFDLILGTWSISGTVVDAVTQQPIANADVGLLGQPELSFTASGTDANGHYAIYGVSSGAYKTRTAAANYVSQSYNGHPYLGEADTIVINPGDNLVINFNLNHGAGSISGMVYGADGITPVPNAIVQAYVADSGVQAWGAQSNANGQYIINNLLPGNYKVQATSGGLSEWYHDKGSFAEADAVAVASLANTPNINFTLGGNQAQAAIQHTYSYSTQGDVLSDTPVLMRESWGWWVDNLIDAGEVMTDVKFTAETTLPVIWEGQPPSSSSPGTYVWDYGVDVPENYSYWAGGRIEPGLTLSPGTMVTREVSPSVLDSPETLQTVSAMVTFTSLPPNCTGVTVFIGDTKNVLSDGLVTTETISQNDVPNWTKYLSIGTRAAWSTGPENIQLGVSYNFVATVKSVKSPLITGDVVCKPFVGVGMYGASTKPPISTGTSCSLSHPDGVNVTFETANTTEWHPYIGNMIEVKLQTVAYQQGGSISGHVYEANGTTGIQGAEVTVRQPYMLVNPTVTSTHTGSDGSYTINNIPPGTYKVDAWAPDHLRRFWQDTVHFYDATPVTLTGSSSLQMDFNLETGGSISGQITSGGSPLANISVAIASSENGLGARNAVTDNNGNYHINGLPYGSYIVFAPADLTTEDNGYIRKFYDAKAGPAAADPVIISSGSPNAINKDIILEQGGYSISGRVYDAVSQTGIHGARVRVMDYPKNQWIIAYVETAEDGSYAIHGLAGGQYLLHAEAPGHVLRWWDDTLRLDQATPIVISSANVSGKDFSLEAGGTISGFVTSSTGTPLTDISVMATRTDGDGRNFAISEPDGHYVIPSLPFGSYKINAPAGLGIADSQYQIEYYNDKTEQTADSVVTSISSPDATGKDFALVQGGSISGTITYTGTVTGTHTMYVVAGTGALEQPASFVGIPVTGQGPYPYTLSGLPTGNYWVLALLDADDSGAPGGPTPGDSLSFHDGRVTVMAGQETSGIDWIVSDPNGSISGTITYTGTVPGTHPLYIGAGIEGIEGMDHLFGTITQITGQGQYPYTISGVTAGTYRVTALMDADDSGVEFGPTLGDPLGSYSDSVAVSSGQAVTGIDFTLGQQAMVSVVTGEVNCAPLGGVTITRFQNGIEISSVTTDPSGNYGPVPVEAGTYQMVASKASFRDETWTVTITGQNPVTLDFTGEHGLVPNAPSMSYALDCVNRWLYPDQAGTCALSMSKALGVVNAWLNPLEPVRIGFISDWTGPAAIAGVLMDQSITVVQSQVAATGGILGGRPVEILKYDAQSTVSGALAGFIKFVQEDNVSAVVGGGTGSTQLGAGVDPAQTFQVPFFYWGLDPADLTSYPYTVRAANIPMAVRAQTGANFLLNSLNPETVGLLGDDSAETRDLMAMLKGILVPAGVEVVCEMYVPIGVTDFSPYLTRVRYENPDVLISYHVGPETYTTIFTQIMELGGWGNIKFLSLSAAGTSAVNLPGATGTYHLLEWFPALPYQGNQKFVQDFVSMHGTEPNIANFYGYMALWDAIKAIELAGTDDPQQVAQAARSGNLEWNSPAGPYGIGTNGEHNMAGQIAVVQGGQLVPVQ